MTFNFPSLRSLSPTRTTRTKVENLMDDFFNFSSQFPQSLLTKEEQDFYPQLDISDANSHYRLEMDLPGVKKEDVDIKVDNNIITIKGKKEINKEQKDTNFYSRERFCGNFQRSLALPLGIKADKIQATFKDGVLTIDAPKTDVSSTKTVEIKS